VQTVQTNISEASAVLQELHFPALPLHNDNDYKTHLQTARSEIFSIVMLVFFATYNVLRRRQRLRLTSGRPHISGNNSEAMEEKSSQRSRRNQRIPAESTEGDTQH